MKKKILSVVLCTAMVTSMLVGCGGKEKESSAPVADDSTSKTIAESTPAEDSSSEETPAGESAGGDFKFEIIVKSYQSSYWQAAVTGVNQAAEELGVTVSCTGPNAESDIADQVNMLNSAINNAPDGIGLAACDQDACLDALQVAMDKGIPVVCFDSGIPKAPAGSVLSTIATDNYGAGATAADNLYAALKEKIAGATAPVRVDRKSVV